MPFEIIWSNRAKKDLIKLEKHIAKRIINKIVALPQKEKPLLEKVKGKDFFKYRVGDYRVLIDRYPLKKKLVILTIMHRKKAYKNI